MYWDTLMKWEENWGENWGDINVTTCTVDWGVLNVCKDISRLKCNSTVVVLCNVSHMESLKIAR
eukprot:scaffold8798_cov87-Skeletonema_dohrnii-CCMP3373.AAC.1